MAACSPVAAAVGAALRPVLWSHIPYHVPYTLGLALQERLVARRFEARAQLAEQPAPSPASRVAAAVAPSSTTSSALQRISETDVLLLLEHTPVYTEGRRKGAREAVGDDAERQRLERLGADYLVTQRGGQITYHGPGQLVGYPIWDLAAMQLSTRCYVDKLQTAIAELLQARPFNLETVPPPDDHTGVWADSDHKITSIGIQVRHRITSHGFALNVEAERLLPWFRQIVACGIEGKGMTTLERELALAAQRAGLVQPGATDGVQLEPGLVLLPRQRITVADIAPAVAHQLGATYGRAVEPAPESELRYEGNADGVLTRVWLADEEVLAPQ